MSLHNGAFKCNIKCVHVALVKARRHCSSSTKNSKVFYIYIYLYNISNTECALGVFSHMAKKYIYTIIYIQKIYIMYIHTHTSTHMYIQYTYIYIYIYIHDTLALIIDEKKFKILFGLFFSFCQSTHWKNHIWLESLWNISQSSKAHATHRNASDWQIFKNKQGFYDFWAISCRFVHIVMLIRIQMHLVLLTTISLIFVWEGHFWIILKKGQARGSIPQSPCPWRTLCISLFMYHGTHTILRIKNKEYLR